MEMRSGIKLWLQGGVASISVLVLADRVGAIVTSDFAIDVASEIGADVWYAAGYTGTGARVANVEAGHGWSGHSSLSFSGLYQGSGGTSGWTDHATAVSFALAGRGTSAANRGIAFGSSMSSGAIATSINGSQFGFTGLSFRDGLLPHVDVGGVGSDVVNFSWGDGSTQGNDWLNTATDAVVAQTRSLVVVASGNTGFGSNRVGSPARGFNVLSVGALTRTGDGFDAVAGWSSGGAVDYWDPATGGVVRGARAGVDLVAPGSDLRLAGTGGADDWRGGQAGTSFASPIAAGGAALLVDAGRARFGGGVSIDPRTLKSVLMNSARKIDGWDNGQRLVDGVLITDRALDLRSGAGALDLGRAYEQYLGGDADLEGEVGGEVGEIGWDFARVAADASTEYRFAEALEEGSTLTLTLNWMSDARWDAIGNGEGLGVSAGSLDDLDLEVWRVGEDGGSDVLVARSESRYDSVEHLSFEIGQTAEYVARVVWRGETFDLRDDVDTEYFSIAWSGVFAGDVVPGPTTLTVLAGWLVVGMRPARRR